MDRNLSSYFDEMDRQIAEREAFKEEIAQYNREEAEKFRRLLAQSEPEITELPPVEVLLEMPSLYELIGRTEEEEFELLEKGLLGD